MEIYTKTELYLTLELTPIIAMFKHKSYVNRMFQKIHQFLHSECHCKRPVVALDIKKHRWSVARFLLKPSPA